MTNGEQTIMQQAYEHYGKQTQIIVCIEELSELTKELTKHLRDSETSLNGITEEVADVSIVLDEIKMIFGIHSGVESIRAEKLKRLQCRIDNEKLHRKGEVNAEKR